MSIVAISWLRLAIPSVEIRDLLPSFGAAAVLMFGAPTNNLSQPRCCFFGQAVSAFIGVCARLVLWDLAWLAAPIGLLFSLLAMQILCVMFPPAGATALLAAYALPLAGGANAFLYVAAVALAAAAQIAVALLWNNLHPHWRYPIFWW